MDHEIGVGILGAGGIAALSHLPEIREVEGLSVVHLAGRRESRLQRLQDEFLVPRSSTDWAPVLADPDVDAIVVALPHPLHAEAVLRSLEAGKHVLVTKPLCDSHEDLGRLLRAADAHPDLVIYARPDVPGTITRMRDAVADGLVGTPTACRARYAHGGAELYYRDVADYFGEEYDPASLWFFDPKRAGVGVLFDLGVYAITRLCAVMGRVARVLAATRTVEKPTELEDNATILLEFENGAVGTMETSWTDPVGSGELAVYGTKGQLRIIGAGDTSLELLTASDPSRIGSEPVQTSLEYAASPNQHAEWLACIREVRQPEMSNVAFAAHVTAVLLAAHESAGSNRWTPVRRHR